MTGAMVSPFSSWPTSADRIRSGPREPVASAPWQNPQAGWKSARPRSTDSGEGGLAATAGATNNEMHRNGCAALSFFIHDGAGGARFDGFFNQRDLFVGGFEGILRTLRDTGAVQ